ncbi:hypothetical protein O0I10_008381 [Lichtheimia ornata]|uniref:INO80 complex subunit B-like conserved region domain-containing protein n=1 Tax=Lichtheimia ornata TaxID=688661 RepID=A0AAD7XX10_9FUNG|nr:uncharacterized protein O0I10_008381 [Lichtheimia ornata]KAJ8655941.1 hypothetical protein O0I10_008381 [Lichtheimia ornata]
MKRTHDDPESPLSSLDSQEELSEEELEDELDDDIVNPDVDELEEIEEGDEEGDDLDDLSDEETPTPVPESSRKKKSMKRKRPVYQEPNSDEDIEEMDEDQEMEEQQEEEEEEEEEDDEGDDLEVVSNRPLTKRQRAKFNNDGPEEFLELPMDSGKKNILTEEEQALRRSEVARRRKNQSIQRAEKDKEDTINRLLKKQASKSRKVIKDDANEEKDNRAPKRVMPPDTIKYVNDAKGSVLMIPSAVAIEQVFGHPPRKSSSSSSSSRSTCQVDGCNASKKYVASKSGKAVCSLEHYKIVEAK